METVGYANAKKIIELNKNVDQMIEEIEELGADLCGAEINLPDRFYCMIDYIEEDRVVLYVEDEDGESSEEVIQLEELLKYL